ncbi:MAG: TetR/AcrR family transcriptional regulator [Pseudomonadota bacterium]
MAQPRYQRRKEDRPDEIAAAAMEAFAEHGYAGTKVADVAKRAGVSKGLMYLYFKTKEELFKAVIRSVVIPRVAALEALMESSGLSSEAWLCGPFTEFAKSLPGSHIAVIVRLMIAEGPKHPDLVAFYWDNVVSRGLRAMSNLIERGIESGEFQRSRLTEQPHLIIMPVVFSVIFRLIFADKSLDTDQLIDTQTDLLIRGLKDPADA